ncbi:LPXTG cell wall anchor domain-containing protein [Streptococcus halichoeri]|uniref:LPXTG cell wall anchor domain-containing protein n=1 Tax=Streptococcus halichoeri TaxID=254785 RepID=UPI00135CF07E|nr:LPXTG cell wall anchor domain-containing protein [Streptococcus halichoeri]
MAKHHWNWTKKAVLAGLVVSAGLLSGQGSIKAEDESFDKDALELTYEGARNYYGTDDERLNIPHNVEMILSHLKTEDLMKLVTGEFLSKPNQNPDVRDKLFGLTEEAKEEAQKLHRLVKYSGLHDLLIRKTTGDTDFDSELFANLLLKEIFRRSEKYQETVDSLKKTSLEAQRSQESFEKILQEKEENILVLAQDWHRQKQSINSLISETKKLKNKSNELTSKLDASKQTNSDLQTKMKDLEAQSQKTSADLKASQEKVNALNKQISDSTSQNQNLQASLEQEKKNLNDLQQRFDAATKANTEDKAKLQSELDAKQAEVAELQAKVDESKITLDKLTTEKDAADAKVAELTAEKDKLTQEKNSIQTQLNSQTELSAEEKAKLEKQLADIQSKIAEKDASIKSLEGQLDTLKRQEHDTTPSTPEAPQVPEVKPEDKPAEPQQPETKPQAPHAPEAGKPSTPEKPEIKPAPTPASPEVKPSTPHTPEKPGKDKPAAPKAHHAATPASPHMAASSTPNTAAHLPQTGETTVNPFFTVAALSVIASAGVLATKRKED